MTSVWVVLKKRHTDAEQWTIVLGVYDYFGDAFERVNEVFYETEENYIEAYGESDADRIEAENHNNGYAEISFDDGADVTIIKAEKYDINKPTYDEI